MVVRIGEVTHEAPGATPAAANDTAQAGPAAPAALQAQILAAIAREQSRFERLWAD